MIYKFYNPVLRCEVEYNSETKEAWLTGANQRLTRNRTNEAEIKMSMTVMYTWHDLAAMADFFENKAREEREGMKGLPPHGKRIEIRRERATVFEMVASIIRKSEINPEKVTGAGVIDD